MRLTSLVLGVCLGLALPAAADTPKGSGFVVHGVGELRGRITDDAGHPRSGVTVHVASQSGTRDVVADKDGKYRVTLDEHDGSTYVYVDGVAKVTGAFTDVGDDDTITTQAMPQPAVMPKPKTSTAMIPDYSKLAIDKNAWARAWIVVDVDEAGNVAHLKLLNDPGYDLAPIAIRTGFALQWEPALDAAKHPVHAQMLWDLEWPAYDWLRDNTTAIKRKPTAITKVACRTATTSPKTVARDCTEPDMKKAASLPWLDPPPPPKKK